MTLFDSDVKPYHLQLHILPIRERHRRKGMVLNQKSEHGRQIPVDLEADADLDDNWRRPGHITSPLQVENAIAWEHRRPPSAM